jgi:hypothetical protein
MGKCLLAAGLVLDYCYLMEYFTAFYSANEYESSTFINRWTGAYAPLYWVMITCNAFIIQLLWFKQIRLNPVALFFIGLAVIVGMWLERLIFIVTSLYRDFLPSAWGMYYPTVWDWVFLCGSIGTFAFLFLLFVRLLPVMSMFEMRHMLHKLERARA